MITGSFGTGKKLLAKAIHRLSSKKDKPVIRIDCKRVSFNLLTSVLLEERTIILDDIHKMSLEMQKNTLKFFGQSWDFGMGRVIATRDDLNTSDTSGKFLDGFQHFSISLSTFLPFQKEKRIFFF